MPDQQPDQAQLPQDVALPSVGGEAALPLNQPQQIAQSPPIGVDQPQSPQIIQAKQAFIESSTPRPRIQVSRLAIVLTVVILVLSAVAFGVYRFLLTLPPKYKNPSLTTYQQASVKIINSWQKSEILGVATLKDIPKNQTSQNAVNAYQFITYVPALLKITDINEARRLDLVNLLDKKQDSFLQSAVFKENCKVVKDVAYEYQAPRDDSEFMRTHFDYTCKQSVSDDNPGIVSGSLVISKKGQAISTAVLSSEKIWNANSRTFDEMIDSLLFASVN